MPDTELLPKSKPEPEPVRRLEVFTGTGRRRKWTAQQKARIVAESHEGEASVCAVARRHGLTPQQLFGWRRQARRRAEAESACGGSVFAPVIVEGAQSCAEVPRAPDPPGGSCVIEIVIGVATIRISGGIHPASLAAVLRAVRAAT